jgi:hypothetical protein
MRIWTLHPKYLDTRGLAAVWREGLLAQAVLQGRTRGYRHHPQLTRFRQQADPAAAVATYLQGIWVEAAQRGFCFDDLKIGPGRVAGAIPETEGQLQYEWQLLKRKLQERSPAVLERLIAVETPDPHPIFTIVPGGIQGWEKVKPD